MLVAAEVLAWPSARVRAALEPPPTPEPNGTARAPILHPPAPGKLPHLRCCSEAGSVADPWSGRRGGRQGPLLLFLLQPPACWRAGQLASAAGRRCPVSREVGLNPAWRDAQGWGVRVGSGCRVGLGGSCAGGGAGFGIQAHTCVPQGSSHPAPVLLFGTNPPCLEAPAAQPPLYKQMTSTAAGCGLRPRVP